MSRKRIPYLRNSQANYLFELFFVNSIASIIIIRVFLHLTGYPKLGGSGLHIAHMLWGGGLMLIGIFLFTFFLDRKARIIASILAGLGFGTFIDELGKFITQDNNYFFRPTFSLIYLIFVIILFAFKYFIRSRPLTREEYLGNYLDLLQDSILGGISSDQKKSLFSLLSKSGLGKDMIKRLNELTKEIRVDPKKANSRYLRLKKTVHEYYKKITRNRLFSKVIIFLFVVWGVSTSTFLVRGLVVSVFEHFFGGGLNRLSTEIQSYGFFDWGALITSFVIDLFVIIGIFNLRGNNTDAYMWFKRAILVSLFVGQFFSFFHNQLLAIFGLIFDLFLYYSLDYIIYEELKIKNHDLQE